MPIQQIAYDIPTNIAIGLKTGTYKRFGGVIRNRKTGAIVKHLKEADVPKQAGSAVFQAVKQHPAASIGIGAAVALGGVATACLAKKKREKRGNATQPACISPFEAALKDYLHAIRQGNLNEKAIDRLLEALRAISETENGAQISIRLSTKELNELVRIIADYTEKLATANSIALEPFHQASSNPIIDLQGYLETQKKLFREAL